MVFFVVVCKLVFKNYFLKLGNFISFYRIIVVFYMKKNKFNLYFDGIFLENFVVLNF